MSIQWYHSPKGTQESDSEEKEIEKGVLHLLCGAVFLLDICRERDYLEFFNLSIVDWTGFFLWGVVLHFVECLTASITCQ